MLPHLEGKASSGNELKLPGVEVWRRSGGKATRVQSLIATAAVKKGLAG